jgi:hypothetical protein
MQNEERILTMLDFIAAELKELKETSATKDELRSFKEQTFDRFNKNEAIMISMEEKMTSMDGRMTSMEENMVTKDDFSAFKRENQAAHESIQAKVDEQGELIEARFDVLNDRLFDQETQLRILKRQDVL